MSRTMRDKVRTKIHELVIVQANLDDQDEQKAIGVSTSLGYPHRCEPGCMMEPLIWFIGTMWPYY